MDHPRLGRPMSCHVLATRQSTRLESHHSFRCHLAHIDLPPPSLFSEPDHPSRLPIVRSKTPPLISSHRNTLGAPAGRLDYLQPLTGCCDATLLTSTSTHLPPRFLSPTARFDAPASPNARFGFPQCILTSHCVCLASHCSFRRQIAQLDLPPFPTTFSRPHHSFRCPSTPQHSFWRPNVCFDFTLCVLASHHSFKHHSTHLDFPSPSSTLSEPHHSFRQPHLPLQVLTSHYIVFWEGSVQVQRVPLTPRCYIMPYMCESAFRELIHLRLTRANPADIPHMMKVPWCKLSIEHPCQDPLIHPALSCAYLNEFYTFPRDSKCSGYS